MSTTPKVAKVVPIKAYNKMNAIERAKVARLPAPIHQAQEKGKQLFEKALRALFDNADDALFELADKATNNNDQNLYFESMREIRIRRRQVEAQFTDQIDNAFVKVASGESPTVSSSDVYDDDNEHKYAFDVEALSIVGNDELEELVAVDSMIARANDACGESLQYLSLRIDSLVPVKIYQKNNPIGPEIICNAFVGATRDLDTDIKAKLVLFKLFDHFVVSQMPSIYDTLNNVLIDHNVLPSLQHQRRVQSQPKSQHPSQQPSQHQSHHVGDQHSSQQHSSSAQGQYVGRGEQQTSPLNAHTQYVNNGQAHQDASANTGINQSGGISGQAQPQHPVGSGSGVGINSEAAMLLSALSQIQSQQTQQWVNNTNYSAAPNKAEISGLVSQLLQGQDSVDKKQADVMNLVKMLFEFILDDRNLAEPMKALISRLQIPILKVAIIDRSFFNKSGHPARRLLNEMATASLGWHENLAKDKEDVPSDPLYKKINSIVQTLLNEFDTNLEIFSHLLADFVSFNEKERRRAQVLEQRIIDAEDGKAKAESAREFVAEAIEKRCKDVELPSDVETILNDAWSNVMFLTYLKEGSEGEGWKRSLQTAEDLIWSVVTPIDPASRKALMTMIPHLIKRLRQGLETISYNPFEMTKLLGQLEKIHMTRLRASMEPVSAPVEKVEETPTLVDITTAKSSEKDSAKSGTPELSGKEEALILDLKSTAIAEAVAKEELIEATKGPATAVLADSASAGGADSHANAEDKAKAAVALGGEENGDIDESYLALVGKLTQGTWFEMVDESDRAYRCRLAAIIKSVGKYIFVNRSGMKVAEKTRESLALAMKNGDLRLLDDTMLFDRALESVIGSNRGSRRG
ncbi:MAG: DUF1631 domain-containing protein [Cellvibrionaceae bacterium]